MNLVLLTVLFDHEDGAFLSETLPYMIDPYEKLRKRKFLMNKSFLKDKGKLKRSCKIILTCKKL